MSDCESRHSTIASHKMKNKEKGKVEDQTMRKKIISVFTVLMCAFMLVGCKNTIEKKYSKKQIQEMNDQAYEQYVKGSSDYKDVKIEIKGNVIYYKYWFNYELDDSQIAILEAGEDSLKKQIPSIKDGIKKDCGIKPEKISYIFYDVNDEEVFRVED